MSARRGKSFSGRTSTRYRKPLACSKRLIASSHRVSLRFCIAIRRLAPSPEQFIMGSQASARSRGQCASSSFALSFPAKPFGFVQPDSADLRRK
jgi:hypothetical protein